MPLYSTTECKNKHSIPRDFQNLAPPNSTIFIWLSNYFPVILSVIEMFNFSEVARNTLILSEQPEVARNTLILSEQPEAAHIWNWWAFWFSWWPWHLTTHSRTPRLNKSQALTQLSQRATLYISLSLKLWQKHLSGARSLITCRCSSEPWKKIF